MVDGTRQQVRTDADSVGALLAAAHVQLGRRRRRRARRGERRCTTASTSTSCASFPVTVDVDGKVRTVRTVETSAEKLAKQLKLGKLTAVRNDPGRLAAGATVVYRTRVSGTLDHRQPEGHLRLAVAHRRRAAAVVQREARRRRLRRCPSPDTVLHDGDQVTVVRVGADDIQSTTQPITFDTVQQDDPTLPIGQTRVIQDGKDGTMTVTYRQLIENGQKGDKQVVSEVPTVEPTPEDHRLRHATPTRTGTSWPSASRVGAGTPSTPAPTAYDGGLGIYRGTWKAFGGAEFAPNAGLATREQQIIVGMRIYEKLRLGPVGMREQRAPLAAVEHVTRAGRLTPTL